MFRLLIALLLCISIFSVQAQEQIEKIFDPADQDWQGKNLGQPGYANTSTAKIGNEWFFIAYNEQTKADIWKTNLQETSLFMDLDASEKPIIRGAYGDWLIYSDLQNEAECRFTALNTRNKQKIDLITGTAGCNNERFSNFFLNDKYLVTIVNNEVSYQDLSTLPAVSVEKNTINDNGVIFIRNLDQNRIILKDASNPFGFAPFYILDLRNGHVIILNNLTNKIIHDVSQFTAYNGKYYFQITTEPYVERLLMSCDTNFSAGSVTNHGNFWGNLLFIENDKAFFSDFNNGTNTLGVYDVNTFTKTDSLETGLNNGYSIWGEATKITTDKYILSSGSQSIFHYDLSENVLTTLMIDSIQQQFAIPWLTIDSGIVIRYRDNDIRERMFYFPFTDLKPREFFRESHPRSYETHIFSALPGNKLLALVYDEQVSSEYAVIDVLNDNYQILADIHTANQGYRSQCNFTYLLPDHQIFIGVNTEFGSVGFLYNPITRESNPILDSNGLYLTMQTNELYGNINLYTSIYAKGRTEYSHHGILAHDDSTIYFIGNEYGEKELKLFAYNYKNRKLESVGGIHRWDKIFKVGSEIYVIRSRENDWNLKSRKVLHWSDNQLITIYEATQPDNCYDEEDIHQYFIHNNFLYFTVSGKLYSLDSRNNQLTLLVDKLIKNSEGCYTDGVFYGNFVVKDNHVYFTESRSAMFYFYISFIGFTWEIEQNFWTTDGTKNGTILLSEMKPEQSFDFNNYGITHMFTDNDEMYMFSNQSDNPGRRLYRWTNNQWQVLNVLLNDTLMSIIPNLGHYESLPLTSKPGANQRVIANWNNTSYFITTSYPDGLEYSPTRLGYIYSFKGGAIPQLKKEREYLYSINTETRSRDASPTTQIGNKWYFPFNYREENVQYNYFPEIHEYDLSNKRLRNIINDNTNLLSFDEFIVKDEALETGYFLLAENHSYYAKVYRLNSCPLIDEPVNMYQLNTTICQNESIQVKLEGLSSLNWILIKVNGVETNYEWQKKSDSDTFLIFLDTPKGENSIAYFLNTGCGIDSIASYRLDVMNSEFTISSTPNFIDSTYTYTSSDQTSEEYQWIVNGGDIISGQSTYTINVNWGQNSEGSVSLVTQNGLCISDTVTVTYSSTTSVRNKHSKQFKVFPNPSTGQVTIELPENWKNASYQLMSIDGRIIENRELHSFQTTLNLSKLSSGLYLISLKNENDFITQRLVLMD